ncbi:type II toxin-antitoxin system HipA family toxin [Poseidonibacter lekithochrous]|uniref:type II toxin-antitoxin system HipA family toxin n=1 Tax=Poseidonibacter lekithochrous TaxID=1904463 RepID=UPI0008FC8EFB|nr:type II toxin-antitoxin system HipA family toxin [Poseidonibacter lekithochrous]QKJ22433.1 toxin-antitoxin system, toxin component, HipA family [Poseidonibacter lekithochrous]
MIYIINNNKSLGVLTQDHQTKEITFKYNDGITNEEYIHGLTKEVNTSFYLFPVFENMLPEHDQKKLLVSQNDITNDIDILAYLDNIHGSFEFYTDETIKQFEPEEWETFNFNEKAKEILNNDYEFPNILSDYTLDIDPSTLYPTELANSRVIGLSGYQYKFSVLLDDKTKTITHDSSKSSNYFMKPYSKYYSTFMPRDKARSYIPYLLINEHLFMTIARDFGFDVPYSAIIKHGVDYHYIIKRYDRYKHSKIDHTEILTLMNKESEQKYKVSMQDVFEAAQEYLDNDEQLKLLKFIIFSIVIAHGDLHAKNLSLINSSNDQKDEKKQVSPFYDISTTKIYKDTKTNDIGLKVLNKTFKINREFLLKFADLLNIDREIVKEYINEICSKFKDTFLNYVDTLPSEIKGLPFHKSAYSQNPFEVILKNYYEGRIKYINEYLLDKDTILEEEEDDFWD